MPATLTIKQLHAATGRLVRKAALSRTPTMITDRGQPVALLVAPDRLLPPVARRPRQILPEYAALMRQPPGAPLADDLNILRDDR